MSTYNSPTRRRCTKDTTYSAVYLDKQITLLQTSECSWRIWFDGSNLRTFEHDPQVLNPNEGCCRGKRKEKDSVSDQGVSTGKSQLICFGARATESSTLPSRDTHNNWLRPAENDFADGSATVAQPRGDQSFKRAVVNQPGDQIAVKEEESERKAKRSRKTPN